MKLSGNTILITGGASGIGFALTEELIKRGSKVLICGRRKERLEQVKDRHPEIDFIQCDVTDKRQRIKLFEWATSHEGFNMLVNNAGIQRNYDFAITNTDEYDAGESEIDINLKALIHLCELFTPFLMTKAEAAILNISSSLGVIHMAEMPVYSATKAAVHAFSRCLREQLINSNVKIFEALPPAVESELNPLGRVIEGPKKRMPADEYAISVVEGLESDKYEINSKLVDNLGNKTLNEMYEQYGIFRNPH